MLPGIQNREQIAEGIEHVSTAGHGYYFISRERLIIMQETTPALLTRSKFYPHWRANENPQYFEEDCEWSRVVLAFPDEFESDIIAAAERVMLSYNPDLAAFLGISHDPQ